MIAIVGLWKIKETYRRLSGYLTVFWPLISEACDWQTDSFGELRWRIRPFAIIHHVIAHIRRDSKPYFAQGLHKPVYAIVRHPLYLASFILIVGTPLALESYWALIPVAMGAIVLIVRTAWEDRLLYEELDGYKDYAQRVRYRLIPGVW